MRFNNLWLPPSILWKGVLNMNWGHCECVWLQKSKMFWFHFLLLQGSQNVGFDVGLAFKILWCNEDICWMCKSDTNGGRVWQQDFVAIANGCFSIPKSQHEWRNLSNTINDNDKDDYIFGAMISNEATLSILLKNELCLFRHLHVKLKDFILPLILWKSMNRNFPTFLWFNKF